MGYPFRDPGQLFIALSHRSYVNNVKEEPRPQSNERMEFLGDAVLNAVVTNYLYQRHPERDEGDLSKMKSLVVSAKVLALCAAQWNLGEFILLSKSEEKTGGRKRPSIMADAYEAVLGAVFLDGGFEPVTRLVHNTLIKIIDDVLSDEELANYKSLLLEYTQSQGLGVPVYDVLQESGPEHRKIFSISVKVRNQEWGRGEGPTKKAAEQAGAREAWDSYGGTGESDGVK